MESGVSEDAMSGHIQVMMPGRTACFQCVPPLAIASNMDEKQIRRNGVCTASLPTTMSIIAGFLAHNALKYLLRFGQLVFFQGYQSLTNYFPTYIIRPSVDCCNADCRYWQSQYPSWSPENYDNSIDNKKSRDLVDNGKMNEKTSHSIDEFGEWEVTYPKYLLVLFSIYPFSFPLSFTFLFKPSIFFIIHQFHSVSLIPSHSFPFIV